MQCHYNCHQEIFSDWSQKVPCCHSSTFSLKIEEKDFFKNIFVKIQQMLHEDVQEISLQLSPRNMTTENSPLEIQFRNNIQIIFDSTLNNISPNCWKAVIMVVAMPVIYNDCGEASNDCKIVVTDLKTDNYLWQALTLKCWWLIIALKSHLFLCFALSFYIFKGTWSKETLTKKKHKMLKSAFQNQIFWRFSSKEEVQRTTKQLLFNLLLSLTYMIVRAHVVALNTLASTLKSVDSTTHLIFVQYIISTCRNAPKSV